MAANYTFGVGGAAVGGIAIESLTAENTHQFMAEAKNLSGVVDAVKMGNATGTCSISGFLKGATPAIGSTLSIEGRSFIVDKVTTTETNTDFKKAEITGKFWEDIAG